VRIDHIVPIAQMAALLTRLVRTAAPHGPALSDHVTERMEMEVGIARGASAFERGMLEAGDYSPFTCPECHGALVEIKEGAGARFRCHTGHAYSSSALLASVSEAIEDTLWQSMQRVEEATMLLNHFAEHLDADGNHAAADLFHQRAHEAAEQARTLHGFIERQERFSEDSRRAASAERAVGQEALAHRDGRRVPSEQE
jgi:two-component system chemotaxis response regulator CheB